MHTATNTPPTRRRAPLPGLRVPSIGFRAPVLTGTGFAYSVEDTAPEVYRGRHYYGGQAEKVAGNAARRRARNKVARRSRRANRSGR